MSASPDERTDAERYSGDLWWRTRRRQPSAEFDSGLAHAWVVLHLAFQAAAVLLAVAAFAVAAFGVGAGGFAALGIGLYTLSWLAFALFASSRTPRGSLAELHLGLWSTVVNCRGAAEALDWSLRRVVLVTTVGYGLALLVLLVAVAVAVT